MVYRHEGPAHRQRKEGVAVYQDGGTVQIREARRGWARRWARDGQEISRGPQPYGVYISLPGPYTQPVLSSHIIFMPIAWQSHAGSHGASEQFVDVQAGAERMHTTYCTTYCTVLYIHAGLGEEPVCCNSPVLRFFPCLSSCQSPCLKHATCAAYEPSISARHITSFFAGSTQRPRGSRPWPACGPALASFLWALWGCCGEDLGTVPYTTYTTRE